MKNLIFVFAALALVLVSCGGGDTVVGKWQLESVTGEELTDSEKESTMTFNEDGTCENKRGDRVRKATYKVSEDGKTITLVVEGGKEDTMEDVVLTADKLSFKDRDDKITYKRIE
jgi:hypothetical protein